MDRFFSRDLHLQQLQRLGIPVKNDEAAERARAQEQDDALLARALSESLQEHESKIQRKDVAKGELEAFRVVYQQEMGSKATLKQERLRASTPRAFVDICINFHWKEDCPSLGLSLACATCKHGRAGQLRCTLCDKTVYQHRCEHVGVIRGESVMKTVYDSQRLFGRESYLLFLFKYMQQHPDCWTTDRAFFKDYMVRYAIEPNAQVLHRLVEMNAFAWVCYVGKAFGDPVPVRQNEYASDCLQRIVEFRARLEVRGDPPLLMLCALETLMTVRGKRGWWLKKREILEWAKVLRRRMRARSAILDMRVLREIYKFL